MNAALTWLAIILSILAFRALILGLDRRLTALEGPPTEAPVLNNLLDARASQ